MDEEAAKQLKEKFLTQVGNDLNTSMGVTCLYDVLKAPVNDVTKRSVLASFDQVLSLSLLERAAVLREKEAAQAKTASPSRGRATRPSMPWSSSGWRPKRPRTSPRPTASGTS